MQHVTLQEPYYFHGFVSILVFMEGECNSVIGAIDTRGEIKFQSLFLWRENATKNIHKCDLIIETRFQSLFLWRENATEMT